jgi:tetratricopeptide (TPR) repeat protein
VNSTLEGIVGEAQNLLDQRQYQAAIDKIRPILIQDTEGHGEKVYGMSLLGIGNAHEAVQPLLVASKVLTKDDSVFFAYGSALHQIGNFEGALAAFEAAFTLNSAHQSAKQMFLKISKEHAANLKPVNPLASIEILYKAWQAEPASPDLSMAVLDGYIENGWNNEAHQFAAMLPEAFQKSPTLKAKLKAAPVTVVSPPVATGDPNRPSMYTNSVSHLQNQVSTFEECPFCKQQIMVGVHTCPYCKMIIRQKAMPGMDYKPEWQEVTLNILCWIGIIINGIDIAIIFIQRQHQSPLGALGLVFSSIAIGANFLILARNDFAMSIGKWVYLMRTIRGTLGLCLSFSLVSMAEKASEKNAAYLIIFLSFINVVYSGFMVYLLNYEGAD